MIQKYPPMGWNSWNTFGSKINEQLIFETADKLVSTGLAAAGYNYLVIDDCWALKERDENGRLAADPQKFPHGMRYVSDYVHGKGLKFGMYSCAGNLTCAGYPGSFEHEFIDAATFAEWGVDLLKYDYCYHSDIIHGKYLYRRMGLALENCGRDILFSACTWGVDKTPEWIRETTAGMWRSAGDIMDSWESIKKLTDAQDDRLGYGGIGCFNDMDMLVVGMYGEGHVGLEGLSDTQYKTHFSIWSLMGSPLMIGCDVRNMNEAAFGILSNKKVIAINQDPACRQVMKLKTIGDKELRCYARMLEGGDIALGFFNFLEEDTYACFNLDQLGLAESTGKTLELHNLWEDEIVMVINGTFQHMVKKHDTLLYRCRVVNK